MIIEKERKEQAGILATTDLQPVASQSNIDAVYSEMGSQKLFSKLDRSQKKGGAVDAANQDD